MESKANNNNLTKKDYMVATLRSYLLQSGFNYTVYQLSLIHI